MLKYLFILICFIYGNLNALQWVNINFNKISPEIEKCLIEQSENNIVKKNSAFVSFGCDSSKEFWDFSYYVVNKNNSYIYLDKPLNLQKLSKVLDEDVITIKSETNGLFPKLVMQNGDRYAQLCFWGSLVGKDICVINIYVDLVDGKVTFPEFTPDNFFFDSSSGYYSFINNDFDKNESQIIVKKMFSAKAKEFKIPLKNGIIINGKFLSGNKLQVIEALNYRKKNEKKISKVYSFDSKQLED